MSNKIAIGPLNVALLSLLVFAGVACSDDDNNEVETPAAAASVAGTAAQALILS